MKEKIELDKVLCQYINVIRLHLNSKEPVKVKPLKLNLKPNSVPVRPRQCKYGPGNRTFMEVYFHNLIKLGFVHHTENPEWVSAPNIVPIKPPEMSRMTSDYSAINSVTILLFWPVPDITNEFSDVKDSKGFFSIDFCSGYWQMPMAEDSEVTCLYDTSNSCPVDPYYKRVDKIRS